VAQQIISCVARVGERFGVGHVADVLRGQQTERITGLGHDKLSTYGLLQDRRDRQVKDWIGQLVGAGLLDQTADQYPVLRLNDDSWQVLKGRREVRLTRSGAATGSRRSRAEEVSWEGVNSPLFDALRDWRREVAARKGVPPYTIFHDGTLRDISRVRPTTLEGMHAISGVGEARLRDYGADVLAIVARVSQDLGLSTDNPLDGATRQAKPAPPTNTAAEAAFPHFREGKTVAEVARLLGKMESTACDYLCCFIHQERPDDVDPWIDRTTYDRIAAAARKHGTQRLKPVFLALNQEVPYDAIRIVLTYLNTRTDLAESFGSGAESAD
jgi:ATP-dependent DNA helicase RecQ